MKTVLVFGTFDVLHPGHHWFLRHAANFGDRIVAVVSRDEFVLKWKGHAPVSNARDRMQSLVEENLVDEAILADEQIRTYGVLERIRPDIICLGHDQRDLRKDLKSYLCNCSDVTYNPVIHVLKPWKRDTYSSTKINCAHKSGFGGGSSRRFPWLYILVCIAMISFGFSWVSGKTLSALASPFRLTCIRFFLTMIFFLPLNVVGRQKPLTRRGVLWTLFSAIFLVAYNLLFFFGLNAGLAGKGGLIVTTTNPLFTFFILSLVSLKSLKRMEFIGVILGSIACIILVEPWSFSIQEITDAGNLIFIVAALCWSVLTIGSQKAQDSIGFQRFNLILYLIAFVVTLPFALMESGFSIRGLPHFWFHMLYLSGVVGAYGTGIYFFASSRLGAGRGSAFTYLVPLSALFSTWFILKETPDIITVLGAGMACSAFILINLRSERHSSTVKFPRTV